MKNLILIILLLCVCLKMQAQSNFVKNPSFEKYDTCPYEVGQLKFVKYWKNAVVPDFSMGAEYFNKCSAFEFKAGMPNNGSFYQFARSGNAVVGVQMFYNKTPPSPDSLNEREYLNGRLHSHLIAGKNYCVSFWVNGAEAAGYVHNKIGAYLDDGSINSLLLDKTGEITSVVPQVYTNDVIADTMNWVKIEGSFTATGNETHITIGNFFPNSALTKVITNYWFTYKQYSYYLIDDVSVIPIDLDADAGKDTWVEMGKQVQIGRVGDTTAIGLDCKWYHKGVLIDSGAIITVNANAVKNAVDTYVVVQTICGLVKTDTVTVRTAGLGVAEMSVDNEFSIYPNPSNGNIVITSTHAVIPTKEGTLNAKVYDLLGRVVHLQNLSFINKEASLNLNLPSATYILELKDEAGNVQRERIVIE